ncbi:MAG: hypothetical protein HY959_03665 [Ignavibacteriae bacterium]|nr:hypothetical protein [Ignavibacteriota bacterium]
MELLLPQTFVDKVVRLISNQLPHYGRTQASIMAGVMSEIGEFLKARSEFTISTTDLDLANRNGKGQEVDQQLSYAMAATPLYHEYLFLEKYSELTSNGKMNVETLCDFFMKRIYKMTYETGFNEALESTDFMDYFSLVSEQKVQNIFSILHKTGLIEVLTTLEDGTYIFTLSGLGEHHVEQGGKTGILKSYLNKSTSIITDKRVFITNTSGQVQVNVDSPNSTQNVTINNNDELFSLLDKMISILRSDSNMKQEEKDDAVLNIESLKTELKKSNPKFDHLKDYLAMISHSMNIAHYLPAIKNFLITKYPEIEHFISKLITDN